MTNSPEMRALDPAAWRYRLKFPTLPDTLTEAVHDRALAWKYMDNEPDYFAVPYRREDYEIEPLYALSAPHAQGDVAGLDEAALVAAQRAIGMARRVGYTSGEHDRIGNISADPIVEKAIRAYLDALPHSDGAVAEPMAVRDDNLLLTYDAETRRVIVRRSVLRKGGDDQSLGYYTEVVGSGVLDFPWGGWKLVPVIPSEDQWGGLARSLVMWWGMSDRPTGQRLYAHLKLATARYIPNWLYEEIPDIDHVPPKGTVAACIYRAMLAAAPVSPINPVPAGVGYRYRIKTTEFPKWSGWANADSDPHDWLWHDNWTDMQVEETLRQAPDAEQEAGELGPDGKELAKTEAGYRHVESVLASGMEGPAGLVWYGHAVREAFVAGAEWQERRAPTQDRG